MKKVFVTGAAGFIGSNLVDRLLQSHEVVGFDNFVTGHEYFLKSALQNANFKLVRGDLLDAASLNDAMAGCDFVFHLSANADVRFGPDHPEKDLQQNTVATFNVLEAMRLNKVRQIAFSSTGSIYGEAAVVPTPEDAPFPVQTSLYGASKLACEGMISAYCESFEFRSWIFRFVSILGERYTHGHVFDFYKQLLKDSRRLTVLGNGHQKKSYLYIQDCIDAMLCAIDKAHDSVNIFNLGTEEVCEVRDSIGWITGHLGFNPELHFGTEERGWIGDNPLIFLDTKKIRALGWSSKLTINEAIIKTVDYLQENQQLLTRA